MLLEINEKLFTSALYVGRWEQYYPILGDEPIVGKRRLGHMITTNWAKDGFSIIAQVSLFNWMTYNICLSRQFSGAYKDIKKGHFFDFNSQSILELGTEKPNGTGNQDE